MAGYICLAGRRIAVHPTESSGRKVLGSPQMLATEFYLMCADLSAFIKVLKAKNVKCSAIHEERWGICTTIRWSSGGEIGLYQPKHPTALNLPQD